MRVLVVVAWLFLIAVAGDAFAQPAGQNKKESTRPRPNYDPPKTQRPDAATLTQIAEKTDELRAALASLRTRNLPDPLMIDVEIYLKAAENIVRFDEWYTAESGKWALTTLDQGLARAKQAEGGSPVWANAPGQWVLRAYRSAVEGSIQPFAVLLPADYDPSRQWRLDVVLHGRDSSLTEAKFIATHVGNAPEGLGQIQLEVYGRGNNAYR
ncbi:MAG: hypothetical protein NT069_36210, partial [Planctomycetota bacterium]|nr:hypothetical protein [Planctomycetota bacterium]